MAINNDTNVVSGQLITTTLQNNLKDDANNILDNVHPQYNEVLIDPHKYKIESKTQAGPNTKFIVEREQNVSEISELSLANGGGDFKYDQDEELLDQNFGGFDETREFVIGSIVFERKKVTNIDIFVFASFDKDASGSDATTVMRARVFTIDRSVLQGAGLSLTAFMTKFGDTSPDVTISTFDATYREYSLGNKVLTTFAEDDMIVVTLSVDIESSSAVNDDDIRRFSKFKVIRNYADSN